MSDLTVPLQSFLRANERCCELLKEKEALRAENERLRVCMAGEGERLTKSNRELRDENKRLKVILRKAIHDDSFRWIGEALDALKEGE